VLERTGLIAAAFGASVVLSWVFGYNYATEKITKRTQAALVKQLEYVREVERDSVESERQINEAAARRERLLEERYRSALADIGPVRVCVTAPGSVPDAASAARDHQASAAGDELSAAPSRDIAPDLVEMTRIADRQAAQVLACNEYADAMEAYIESIASGQTKF